MILNYLLFIIIVIFNILVIGVILLLLTTTTTTTEFMNCYKTLNERHIPNKYCLSLCSVSTSFHNASYASVCHSLQDTEKLNEKTATHHAYLDSSVSSG